MHTQASNDHAADLRALLAAALDSNIAPARIADLIRLERGPAPGRCPECEAPMRAGGQKLRCTECGVTCATTSTR
jgi:tRNA(Ile2) C34 agmatinyltransferase TiaS